MAEECRFYYWDAGYSCALKRDKEGDSSIDSDIVHRYCWGYQYEECPRYKAGQSSGGGCFLTSACVEAKGLPDDCHELTVLRNFRDTYLAAQDCGKCEIAHYYQVAPAIVEKIKASLDADVVFNRIHDELVIPCVNLIEEGNLAEAHTHYRAYVKMLENAYATN